MTYIVSSGALNSTHSLDVTWLCTRIYAAFRCHCTPPAAADAAADAAAMMMRELVRT